MVSWPSPWCRIFKRAKLVQRVQAGPEGIFRQRIFFGRDRIVGGFDVAGDFSGLGEALLLSQELQRHEAPAAGENVEGADFDAIVKHGPDIQFCSMPRWAMSAARSSIETPFFTRRTLASEATSLLRGIF